MDLLRNLRFARRLAILVGIFAGGFLLYGLCSFRTLDALRVNGPLYGDVIQGKDLIADVLPPPLYIIESFLVAQQLAAATGQVERDHLAQRLRTLHAQQMARAEFWQGRQLDQGLAQSLRQANRHATAFYTEAFGQLVPALELGDRPRAERALLAMQRQYELHRQVVDDLVAQAASRARFTEAQAADRVQADSAQLLVILAVFLALTVALASLISRSITQPLSEALALAQRVRGGDLSSPAPAPYRDETGELLAALHALQQGLAEAAAGRADCERKLRCTRALLDRLLHGTDLLVLGLGHEGEVLLFNEAAAQATGCSRDSVLGRLWRDMPLLPMSAVALWPAGGHPEQWRAMPPAQEHPLQTASGDERRIAWRHCVLDEGEIALLSFGIDVTALRRAEHAIAAAQATADQANRSKAAFLANMSHEIRTPLNAIIGLSALALQGDLAAHQRSYLQQIDAAAASLLAMFNDILDFSRIEAGQFPMAQCAFNVRQAAEQACAACQAAAQDKGLQLACTVQAAVPAELVGDAARLQQLLQHLLGHAVRFTEQGKVQLLLREDGGSAAGTILRCEVHDTGMARDAAVQMYEPAGPGDSAAGLGLSVARQLAAMMGGHLLLESDPVQGNRFIFTALFPHALPGGAGSAEAQAAARAAYPALTACGADLAGARARCQGNGPQLRKLLVQFLQGQAGIHALIGAAVAQGDSQRAQRLAHTLAGLSAQLGMEALRRAAAEVLNALRAGSAAADELAHLAPLLEQMLRALHADLQAGSGEQAA
ncbi:histidine kinase dimerization/phospho-acceptor domain-containing protein [Pseudoduganella violaceinigra]|uniref:histidine kinase dimerization/phospho-acceptor domain-containing protein n=1 Tax=Pseudoduganella violaceinigra TaxID=246602 RepID=UPI000417E797|nr:histidine kinase dimerization/phospho-acceptor domain-containing protein [Pseudoduganella violaceinigra]